MKNIKLNWKKKTTDDESGYWYSAKVPVLNWEYVVDVFDTCSLSYLFMGPHVDELQISKTKFKTSDLAKKECEKHLAKTFEKFQKFIDSNTYETTR
jgi:hypothetical protein